MEMNRENGVARDFLGLSAPSKQNSSLSSSSETSAVSKLQSETNKPVGFKENVYLTNHSMQWPHSNKVAALQQFICFKNLQDGQKKGSFDKLPSFSSISTADAFALSKNHPSMQTSFRSDPLGRSHADPGQYQSQYGTLNQHAGLSCIGYSTQVTDDRASSGYSFHNMGNAFASSNGLYPIPNLVSPACFKGDHAVATRISSPVAGHLKNVFGHSAFSLPVMNMPSTNPSATGGPEKKTTAQLTIFYAGTVHVYDDIPADKAQALMSLAGSESSFSGKTGNSSPESSTSPISVGTHVLAAQTSPLLTVQSLNIMSPKVPTSENMQIAAMQTSQPNSGVTSGGIKTTERNESCDNPQIAPKPHVVNAIRPTPLAPRVPIARKASLARFLEKRKERALSAAPYTLERSLKDSSYGQKSPHIPVESNTTPDDSCMPIKDHQEQLGSAKAVKTEVADS
eukprot:TRINITY_DN14727_c0_g1_i1.p1 TRINITY_DN14727_c0_g1~~TRINITY_DN14727_c0_g1_i1.p1  ORF type:complete len:454 (-),score=96.23 TRINITY_DN14727_c0_g1_i1:312-1673(-)